MGSASYKTVREGCRFYQLDLFKMQWMKGDPVLYPPIGQIFHATIHPHAPDFLVVRNARGIFTFEGSCFVAPGSLAGEPQVPPAEPVPAVLEPLTPSVAGFPRRDVPVRPTQPAPVVAAPPTPAPMPAAPVFAPSPIQAPKKKPDQIEWTPLVGYWAWQDKHTLNDFILDAETPLRSNIHSWSLGVEVHSWISSDLQWRVEGNVLLGSVRAATVNSNYFLSDESSLIGVLADPSLRYAPQPIGFSVGAGIPIMIRKIFFPVTEDYTVIDSAIRLGILLESSWRAERLEVGMKFGFIHTLQYPLWSMQFGWKF